MNRNFPTDLHSWGIQLAKMEIFPSKGDFSLSSDFLWRVESIKTLFLIIKFFVPNLTVGKSKAGQVTAGQADKEENRTVVLNSYSIYCLENQD